MKIKQNAKKPEKMKRDKREWKGHRLNKKNEIKEQGRQLLLFRGTDFAKQIELRPYHSAAQAEFSR